MELVFDLSTACFVAVKRFVSRRDGPKLSTVTMEKNYWFGEKIADLQKILIDPRYDSLQAQAARLHIKCFFISPKALDFGDLWESANKCEKNHLGKVMGNQILSSEKMCTLFCQTELILNSRTICPLS